MKNIKTILTSIILLLLSYNSIAQCHLNRHSTSWNDAWSSCETRINPNQIREEGHWILYNFGSDYEFLNSHIWNLNDPDNLESGIDEVIIDYSMDGVNWEEWGSFSIAIADGKSIYSGTTGPNFEGVQAQYILISAISNHGGECYGLSEMKFEINDEYISATDDNYKDYCFNANLSPNPTVGDSKLIINSICNQNLSYRIIDAIGRTIKEPTIIKNNNEAIQINSSNLIPGIYFVEIINQGKIQSMKLVKLK